MTLTQEVIAFAFNEWMRRYTEEPKEFQREWQTISKFLAEKSAGETPSYGACSAAYLLQLAKDSPFLTLVTPTSKPAPPPAPPNRETREGTVPQP